MAKQSIVPPIGKKVSLKDYDPAYTGEFKDKSEAQEATQKDLERLDIIQDTLFAGAEKSVLVVFQAMDTGGKDGAIRHVFKGVDPQGVQISSFKAPTPDELARDFLWRVHRCVPPKGMIGVFNRSHYEDVLVVRVHNLVPKAIWKERYDHINRFEELLSEHGTIILKFFLHISKAEQKERLEARRDDPQKRWKFNVGDLKERERWDDYMAAYEEVLTKCNTAYAPWHIVPANKKWYRNYVITRAILEALEKAKLSYPPAPEGVETVVVPD